MSVAEQSSDGFHVPPVSELGTDYMVITYLDSAAQPTEVSLYVTF